MTLLLRDPSAIFNRHKFILKFDLLQDLLLCVTNPSKTSVINFMRKKLIFSNCHYFTKVINLTFRLSMASRNERSKKLESLEETLHNSFSSL